MFAHHFECAAGTNLRFFQSDTRGRDLPSGWSPDTASCLPTQRWTMRMVCSYLKTPPPSFLKLRVCWRGRVYGMDSAVDRTPSRLLVEWLCVAADRLLIEAPFIYAKFCVFFLHIVVVPRSRDGIAANGTDKKRCLRHRKKTSLHHRKETVPAPPKRRLRHPNAVPPARKQGAFRNGAFGPEKNERCLRHR